METRLIWDEAKRRKNLKKHGLDFADAREVLNSRFRFDTPVKRGGESRIESVSYALRFLAVLTVAHTERQGATRNISFRRASREQRETYYAWIENECDEP